MKSWGPRTGAEEVARVCDQPGCSNHGEYRAPRSRDALNVYYWFCLEHVRAYNAAWDYYAGMTPDEIEEFIRRDVTWQRQTWPLGARVSGRYRIDPARIRDPFGFFSDEPGERANSNQPESPQDAAMRVMSLERPLTMLALKARYKELVKLHHPDANGGDKAAEERFKEISLAYKTLVAILTA